MKLNEFNSEDYIYLRVPEECTINGITYPKGEIIRFKKAYLRHQLWSRHFTHLDKINFEEKPKIAENAIMPYQVYSKITFKEDTEFRICLWPDEKYFFGDWLSRKVTEDDHIIGFFSFKTKIDSNITELERSGYINTDTKTLTVGNRNINLCINFKAGEELDFTNPEVASLFLKHDLVELLSHTELITGEEKEDLFAEDLKDTFTIADYEYHYYKLNPDIKIKNKMDLYPKLSGTDSNDCPYDKDEDGSLRYVFIKGWTYDEGIDRREEQSILEIATSVPREEAIKRHQNAKNWTVSERQKSYELWLEEKRKEEEQLNALYLPVQGNTSLFPGANGEFVHNLPNPILNPHASIEEVREFYKRLKEINYQVLNQMHFYGGTVPYIMANAKESRQFGDIDIFVPLTAIDALREELEKQPSFQYIFDSRNLTEEYGLTSRIQKQEIQKTNSNEQTMEFLNLLTNPNINKTIDENGENVLAKFFKSNRSYYNKPQDFGFKATLFGIPISVFPVYDYEGNLMAKSFNISDLYQFLLGVRVINNTSLSNFSKSINACGTNINIVPLEYTIASKESAINAGYRKREDKDNSDLAFILEHASELGIDQNRLEEIKNNYPDFSIAIAYLLANDQVETIGPELYKRLVLSKGTLNLS